MSSILEALRELEARRPATTRSVAAPSAPPNPVNRGIETVGIAAIGLVVGGLVFAFATALWWLVPATASRLAATAPPRSPSVEKPQAATNVSPAATNTPPGARPAWLDAAEPPRAKIAQTAQAAQTAAAPAPREPASERGRTAGTRGPGSVEVTSIAYSADPGSRAVTLSVDGGQLVTLHERTSAHGIEVQLIERDGVYVRRGGEVIRLAPAAGARD